MTRGLFCRHHRFPANPAKRFDEKEEETGSEEKRLREQRRLVPSRPNPNRKPAKRLRFGKEETDSEDKRPRAWRGDSFRRGHFRRASGGPIFSVLPEKMGEKRGAGMRLVRAAGTVQVSPDL